MNEQSSSSRKLIVAIGMAVVVGAAGITFGVRVHRSTPVAQTPIASAAGSEIPDAADMVPQTVDAASSVAQRDRLRASTSDPAVPGDTAAPVVSSRQGGRGVELPTTTSAAPSGMAANAPEVAMSADPVAPSSAPLAPSIEPTASDVRITTAVQSEIAADGSSEDAKVGVSTTNGVVALTGTLASQDAIDHLKGIAEKVQDVKSVDTSALKIANT
jgi:hyperosmotically inducible protein